MKDQPDFLHELELQSKTLPFMDFQTGLESFCSLLFEIYPKDRQKFLRYLKIHIPLLNGNDLTTLKPPKKD